MGDLARARSYPNASFRDVTAPNADTLYTQGWIDLGKEPYVLSLRDAHGRYYLFPMLDAWTNVFQVPGKRTTGTGPQTYAITGPGWSGTLPAGVTDKSPTNLVWILGRIYCTGTPADYRAVHALQDKITLVPLSSYGKPYTPAAGTVDPNIDMKTAVRAQVKALDLAAYFTLMAQLMKDNPPTAEDAPIVARMAKIGIVPGQPFDITKLPPHAQQALKAAPKAAARKIVGYFKDAGTRENGWAFFTKNRNLWNRLCRSRFHHRDWFGRESAAGCRLSNLGSRCRRETLLGCQQVRHAFRQGKVSSCKRFLVAHDV
jgi:hypothetical protein